MNLDWSIGTVVAVVSLAAAAGLAWPVFRSKSTGATIELLRSELGVEREAREDQQRRCTEELYAERERRAREVGELRGQVQVITASFASVIAGQVIEELRDYLEKKP